MEISRKRLGLLIVIGIHVISLGSCTLKDMHASPPLEGSEKDPLFVSIKPDQNRTKALESTFQKGTPALSSFVLENRTRDFIVLRRFDIKGQLPDIQRWFGPLYGSVEYSAEEDIFYYNVVEQCLSEPVFAMGLIRPRGSIEVPRRVALRDSPVTVEVFYQRIPLENAKKKLYFNFPDAPCMGPKRIFRRIDDFYPFLNESRTEDVDWSTVILKGENELPFLRHEATCTVKLTEPEFSLEKALKKFRMLFSDYIFWKSENCWVFKREKNVFLVGENRFDKLGEIDLAVFILIELAPHNADFILPVKGYEDFNPQMPEIQGPGYFNPGITHIPRIKVLQLFEHAAQRGDRVRTIAYDPHGLGKRFYIAVGEFNEKERRAIADKKAD